MAGEIKKWKTLSSEYLIKRPWLTARRDVVELPSGEVNDEFYILEYPTWINVIAITEEGKFVMVEQYRHGLDEVGIELCAGVVPSPTTNLTYCYIARGVKLTGTQHLDRTEDIRVRLMSRDELYALLVNDGMKQALMAAPLWKYFCQSK